MKEHIIKVSCSTIGTYPLQAVIDQTTTREERAVIIQAVKPHVIELCEVKLFICTFLECTGNTCDREDDSML